mmetsp:Transcript_12246/g.17965  ORF Transcript_12246/g.17965 Transcript_12246/m.17965 type:complete len:221 (-) Transcript_12246:2143-2805(-)
MTTALDVFVFIPNLIGYSRILFTLASFVLMTSFESEWRIAISLYIASFAGDLFDGLAARKFNQCSTFGGLLDMVTDRCSTLGILYVLGNLQDHMRLVYLFAIVLDISSHWCQMYSSIGQGHHKSSESNEGRNFLVQWYYKYYFFFGYLCVGAEFTYILAYILHYLSTDSTLYEVALGAFRLCLPGCFMKQIINIFQLSSACYVVAMQDAAIHTEQRSKQH